MCTHKQENYKLHISSTLKLFLTAGHKLRKLRVEFNCSQENLPWKCRSLIIQWHPRRIYTANQWSVFGFYKFWPYSWSVLMSKFKYVIKVACSNELRPPSWICSAVWFSGVIRYRTDAVSKALIFDLYLFIFLSFWGEMCASYLIWVLLFLSFLQPE